MDYIDRSNTSIFIGLTSFLGLSYLFYSFLVSYRMNNPDVEPMSDNRMYLTSLVLSLISTFIILILFKKYLEIQGSREYLPERFTE